MLQKIVVLFCSILPAFGASNAALIASLSGTATIDKSTPVRSLDWLADGAVLQVGAGSKAIVILLNGRRFELGANARATVGPVRLGKTSGPVHELDPLPPMPKIAPLEIASDAGAATRFRGAGNIKDMCPREGMAALPGLGKLSFQPVDGASAYQIVVEDADGNRVAQRQTTAAEIDVPLQPAARYSWRVRALGPAGVMAEDQAAFVTLAEDQVAARKAFAKAIGPNSALLAEVDFRAGLVREAIDEFNAALQADPSDRDARRGLERLQSVLAGK